MSADSKKALVVGNADYGFAPLKNPVNDATDVAATLKAIGFEVTLLTNASLEQMRDGLDQFGASLGSGDIGLFYYSGHGMQINGQNYLVPANVKASTALQIRNRSLMADEVLSTMQAARNKANILILDACRDNPLVTDTRSLKRGLAVADAVPSGGIVIYSTSADQTADDGAGRNGLFTEALLKFLPEKTTFDAVVNLTAKDVQTKSKGAQIPAKYSSLFDDLYLAGKPEVPQTVQAPAPVVSLSPVPSRVVPTTGGQGSLKITLQQSYKSLLVSIHDAQGQIVPWDGFSELKLAEGPYTIEAKLDQDIETTFHAERSIATGESTSVVIPKQQISKAFVQAQYDKRREGPRFSVGSSTSLPLPWFWTLEAERLLVIREVNYLGASASYWYPTEYTNSMWHQYETGAITSSAWEGFLSFGVDWGQFSILAEGGVKRMSFENYGLNLLASTTVGWFVVDQPDFQMKTVITTRISNQEFGTGPGVSVRFFQGPQLSFGLEYVNDRVARTLFNFHEDWMPTYDANRLAVVNQALIDQAPFSLGQYIVPYVKLAWMWDL